MIKIVLLKPESLIEKYWQVVQVLSFSKSIEESQIAEKLCEKLFDRNVVGKSINIIKT